MPSTGRVWGAGPSTHCWGRIRNPALLGGSSTKPNENSTVKHLCHTNVHGKSLTCEKMASPDIHPWRTIKSAAWGCMQGSERLKRLYVYPLMGGQLQALLVTETCKLHDNSYMSMCKYRNEKRPHQDRR